MYINNTTNMIMMYTFSVPHPLPLIGSFLGSGPKVVSPIRVRVFMRLCFHWCLYNRCYGKPPYSPILSYSCKAV